MTGRHPATPRVTDLSSRRANVPSYEQHLAGDELGDASTRGTKSGEAVRALRRLTYLPDPTCPDAQGAAVRCLACACAEALGWTEPMSQVQERERRPGGWVSRGLLRRPHDLSARGRRTTRNEFKVRQTLALAGPDPTGQTHTQALPPTTSKISEEASRGPPHTSLRAYAAGFSHSPPTSFHRAMPIQTA